MAHFNPYRFEEYKLRKQAGWGSETLEAGKAGIALLHAIGIGGAAAAAYGISRATTPDHIAENADLEVVKNNLMTEIATVQRQVEEERKQVEAAKKGIKQQRPYDKFLNSR